MVGMNLPETEGFPFMTNAFEYKATILQRHNIRKDVKVAEAILVSIKLIVLWIKYRKQNTY